MDGRKGAREESTKRDAGVVKYRVDATMGLPTIGLLCTLVKWAGERLSANCKTYSFNLSPIIHPYLSKNINGGYNVSLHCRKWNRVYLFVELIVRKKARNFL